MKRLAAALALLTTAAGAGVGVSNCAMEVAGALHSLTSSQGEVIQTQQSTMDETVRVLSRAVEMTAAQLSQCRKECE